MLQITNLNQFKTFLSQNVGKEVFLNNHFYPERTRNTKILHVQSNSFCFKSQKETEPETNIYNHAWTEFNAAKTWIFEPTDQGFNATKTNPDGTRAFSFIFKN